MKTKLALLPLVAFFLSADGQDEAARHKERMDTAQDAKDDLKDALDSKSREKAVEPAEKLVQLSEQEEDYWKQAKLEREVKLAQQSVSASRAIAAAVKDERFDEALRAYGELESTCRRAMTCTRKNARLLHLNNSLYGLLLRDSSGRRRSSSITWTAVARSTAIDVASVWQSNSPSIH